jgi:hypothetical protein
LKSVNFGSAENADCGYRAFLIVVAATSLAVAILVGAVGTIAKCALCTITATVLIAAGLPLFDEVSIFRRAGTDGDTSSGIRCEGCSVECPIFCAVG